MRKLSLLLPAIFLAATFSCKKTDFSEQQPTNKRHLTPAGCTPVYSAQQFGDNVTAATPITDADGNIYMLFVQHTFREDDYTLYVTTIKKFSPDGTLIFQKSINGVRFRNLVIDNSGNFFAIGDYISDAYDIVSEQYLFKFNTVGNQVLKKFLGTTGDIYDSRAIIKIDLDKKGNVFVLGRDQPANEFFVHRYNNNGILTGERLVMANISIVNMNMKVTPDDNLVFVGAGITGGKTYLKFVKTTTTGAQIWSKVTDNGTYTTLNSLLLTTDATGNIYLYSYYNIYKLTAGGAIVYHEPTAKDITIKAIAADAKGYLYATGGFTHTQDFDAGPKVFNLGAGYVGDVFIEKFTTGGKFLFATSFPNYPKDIPHSDAGTGILATHDNTLYVTGIFYSTTDFGGAENKLTTNYYAGHNFLLKVNMCD